MAGICPIDQADLLRAAIVIEAAIARVEVEVAACWRRTTEGDDVPRETLRFLLRDLLTLTGTSRDIED